MEDFPGELTKRQLSPFKLSFCSSPILSNHCWAFRYPTIFETKWWMQSLSAALFWIKLKWIKDQLSGLLMETFSKVPYPCQRHFHLFHFYFYRWYRFILSWLYSFLVLANIRSNENIGGSILLLTQVISAFSPSNPLHAFAHNILGVLYATQVQPWSPSIIVACFHEEPATSFCFLAFSFQKWNHNLMAYIQLPHIVGCFQSFDMRCLG